ncbi:hypothetical protein JCM10207_008813 [Rhodosporidiobolus poonsookiae]
METINNAIDQGKGLINQYLNSDTSNFEQGPAPTGDLGTDAHQLDTDRGDATFSGDIERESGSGVEQDYTAYNASGRDATGSFNGGANEDIENLGAGEMPGRS